MTVYEATTVDAIAVEAEESSVILGLIVPGPLKNEPKLLDALATKVNAYVVFLASGGLAEQFPQTEGLTPVIEIAHAGELDDWSKSMLQNLEEQLDAQEIELRTIGLDELPEEDRPPADYEPPSE